MNYSFTGNNRNSDDPDLLEITKVPAGVRITLSTHISTSGFFDPDAAPGIALAILRAAGFEPGMLDHEGIAVHHLLALAEENAAAKQAAALVKRRDELAREFAAGGGLYHSCKESLQKAIDRIIELEPTP